MQVGGKDFNGWVGLAGLVVAALALVFTAWEVMDDQGLQNDEVNVGTIVAEDVEIWEADFTSETQVADDIAVQLNATLAPDGTTDSWENELTLRPGAGAEVVVGVMNLGPAVAENVVVGVGLPEGVTLTTGSTKIANSNYPDAIDAETDNIVSGGIDIGAYAAGGAAYVLFEIAIAEAGFFCGNETLVIEVFARPGEEGTSRAETLLTVREDC